jgi:hypothetical protein
MDIIHHPMYTFSGGWWARDLPKQLWKWCGGQELYMTRFYFYFLRLISWFKYFLIIA